ncbi:MAG TPA: SDR family oxidoreductase [Xanthobacteraceae bacterium]|nr:SDR family oxidoreductase [Xanthobacteraceae bacterium]
MDIRLDGKAAVITGSSKGIGLAIAASFAKSGADVAILARGPDALKEAEKTIGARSRNRVVAVACDVANAQDVRRAYDQVMQELGRIDILVNNAGTSRAMPFEQTTDEIWREDLELKLFAAIRLARLVWPQMTERRWGRIINVLNIGAKAPRAASAPTSVSRAAGMALTKVLAGEGAPHNVLVNALLVGRIESDQWVQRAHKTGVDLDSLLADMGKDIPLGRVGRAEEFANVACFLASDAASYITGTATNIDGGASPVV